MSLNSFAHASLKTCLMPPNMPGKHQNNHKLAIIISQSSSIYSPAQTTELLDYMILHLSAVGIKIRTHILVNKLQLERLKRRI